MLRKALRTGKSLLLDESGQTMLEYTVIVVFVIVGSIVSFKRIRHIVVSSMQRASASIEQ